MATDIHKDVSGSTNLSSVVISGLSPTILDLPSRVGDFYNFGLRGSIADEGAGFSSISEKVSDLSLRRAVIDFAFRWLGVSYRHQGRSMDYGVDCCGFILAITGTFYPELRLVTPVYGQHWYSNCRQEILLNPANELLSCLGKFGCYSSFPLSCASDFAIRQERLAFTKSRLTPGDFLFFRMSSGFPVSHCAIMVSDDTMIHSLSGRSVLESSLTSWWLNRLSHHFVLPSCYRFTGGFVGESLGVSSELLEDDELWARLL